MVSTVLIEMVTYFHSVHLVSNDYVPSLAAVDMVMAYAYCLQESLAHTLTRFSHPLPLDAGWMSHCDDDVVMLIEIDVDDKQIQEVYVLSDEVYSAWKDQASSRMAASSLVSLYFSLQGWCFFLLLVRIEFDDDGFLALCQTYYQMLSLWKRKWMIQSFHQHEGEVGVILDVYSVF